jgi:3-hydroxybutyryl-CoA dehydrogenase
MAIRKVGVVGCGLMGRGIAEVSARSGYDVIVSEVNQELLNKGLASIDGSLTRAIKGGKATEEQKTAALKHIKGTTNTADFKDCDLVVEAAVERLDIKKNIFAELDKTCPPQTILATNTSVISVIDIAAATKRLDKVLGMHFFNPAPVMRLLELVKTIATSEETVKTAKAFGESLGKEVIVAKDTPGFIVNRLGTPLMVEAVRMLENGIATKEDIDRGMKLGMNFPMGPLTLLDFIGLDSIFHACEAMYEETKNPVLAPPLLLRKMVAAGHLGRKSGKGFYDYPKP